MLTGMLCPVVPALATILVGAPGTFVNEYVAFVVAPATVPDMEYAVGLAIVFAVKVPGVAVPVLSVVAVAVLPEPVKVPLAPFAGAVNVTTEPLTEFPS